MKKGNHVLNSINVLNVMFLSLSVVMFFMLAYPLLTTEIKSDIPTTRTATVSKEKQIAAKGIPNILDYFILGGNSFSQPFLLADIKADVSAKDIKDLAVKKEESITPDNVPASLDYVAVAEKNLFHPERRMPADKNAEKVVVRPEIIYYGSIISNEKRIAYIEDKKNPYSTPGRGKRQMPLAQGAMIGGYKLTEVNTESLVLVRGDDKMVVNLRDQKDRQPGEATGKPHIPAGQIYMPPQLPRPTAKPGSIPSPLPARSTIKK